MVIVWEPGGHDGVGELCHRRDRHRLAVEFCTPAQLGGEPLLPYHVEDHGNQRLAVLVQGDRNGHLRDAVHEVDGAVQRIHDPPTPVRCRRPAVVVGEAAFLGEDGVGGALPPDQIDDGSLRRFRSGASRSPK